METLAELCQGCIPNQLTVFDAQVVDAVNYILRRSYYKNAHPRTVIIFAGFSWAKKWLQVAHMKYAAVTLLLALLEDDGNADSQKMAKEIVYLWNIILVNLT